MKNLLNILVNEGILDDLEDNLAEGDKMIEEDIIKSWFVNDRCKMWKQKKGWVLSGNFKMIYDESTYTGPKIKKVAGNFSIFNSELTTLENIFTEDCIIEGTLTIEDNKNLVSLKGLPANLNSVTICGNKKLKEIDTLINADGNVYVSKNGNTRNARDYYEGIITNLERRYIETPAARDHSHDRERRTGQCGTVHGICHLHSGRMGSGNRS